ncbi:phosphomannomutase CpsG [Rheinheimera sp. 4Y26]|uniref:phosphomannomutase CpsG n=1 Tax=Rheinheimera sp. 4Y26 TaxID=2977811 RepID=UPI0021B0A0F5|nr:phosphomannomutase CpsG [Rheinheimera sp. 4Y26]MCT6700680.1 phosphomannomutase CpsG [Rheinheimera sp. 4Y26]
MYRKIDCVKAYDIRGKLGEQLDTDVAYRIGRAFGQYQQAKIVVLGGDVRATSEALKLALADGLMDAGVDVIDLGMTGTEEVYFATFHLGVCGGIEVTASHNPLDYNGMKLVQQGARPISSDSGLLEIKQLAEQGNFAEVSRRGCYRQQSILADFVEHLLGYIKAENFKPLKIVVNSGNGAAGHVVDALEQAFSQQGIPIEFVKVHHEPDATFPNGIPNPLLPENRADTAAAVLAHQADFGVAWDGDFDRCFLFDETGAFIEGYYIVGLLAEAFLQKNPGARIIHDPRLCWSTIDLVEKAGGIAVQSKTGHAFIKERMRKEDAVYGGEMSAHHYFRDFAYCDSGMIPWLLVAELLCVKNTSLSAMVQQRIAAFPSSGEINFTIANPAAKLAEVLALYQSQALKVDHTDGISVEFANWRFNLRSSNTEPLVRLNVESRGDIALMQAKTAELSALLQQG